MANIKALQGSTTQATCVTAELTSSGNTDFGLNQPANTIIEEVYVRVAEAPTITSGDIGLLLGYNSDHTGTEIVSGGTDCLLDEGTTLPANTIYKLSNTTGVTFGGNYATGDAASETANATYATEAKNIYGRLSCSTAASAVGKFEIHVVFRHFH
jgi:hypothetical protein